MSLIKFQEKLGVTADGAFGPGTLKAATVYLKLTTEESAHFFGQLAHESGDFVYSVENLNYSAAGLLKTFGKYFNTITATACARNPEKIANIVYANRMGNGNSASGDGYRFRGRGAIQLTGKSNYEGFSKFVNDPKVIFDPDIVASKYYIESAIYFFTRNNIFDLAIKGVNDSIITQITKKVNGGVNGLEDRILKTKKFYSWLR